MGFFEIVPIYVVLYVVFRYIVPLIWRKTHSRSISNHPQWPRVLYYHIAELEIKNYGQTFANVDSPVPAGLTTMGDVYGISEDGHDKKTGRCNLNASMGPPCKYGGVHPAIPVSPFPTYAGDPNWYDEDGRPW